MPLFYINRTKMVDIHKSRRLIDWENLKERMCALCLRKLPIENFYLSFSNKQTLQRKATCKQCAEFKRLQKKKGKDAS